jgi:AcrR family transcriptional regulator
MSRAKRARIKPPAERREDLLQAAQHQFLKRGVAATTVDQITATARVAKGTFYLYFASKDEVLAALRLRFAQELLARIEAAVDAVTAHHWSAKLSAWVRSCAEGYVQLLPLHDLVFHESPPSSHRGRTDNPIVRHLRELLQAGAKAGAWSAGDAQLAAVFLFSGVHGVVDAWAQRRRARSSLAAELERLCLRALALR